MPALGRSRPLRTCWQLSYFGNPGAFLPWCILTLVHSLTGVQQVFAVSACVRAKSGVCACTACVQATTYKQLAHGICRLM